ncbi:outer membrane beta-barrel protein [Sphingobium yanoikuyae]|uniref:Outer membrane beta-barrel protein n=1 Tax=Sphingobium yanoikuyae TaxID=13690 RepID=A0A9X7UE62_SPHYA|nr:outer membrane beta-barrel protein [Sphingobium yanoikuyae]QNG48497.1 outer membrane beta-barrel protein [Sphingobium yanoikuyae]
MHRKAAPRLMALAGFGAVLGAPVGQAMAQASNSTTLIQPVISPDFRRDRNVSVLERPHPDFDPLGYRLGSFLVNPALTVSPGFTSNVYTDNANKKSDFFLITQPSLSLTSDWNVHRLRLVASGDIRRYAKATVRNQNGWSTSVTGRLDVSQDLVVDLIGEAGRRFESPFADDVVANTTNVSSYLQTMLNARATYKMGRTRFVGGLERSTFEFNSVDFIDRPSRDQGFRDRTMDRITGIADFALSPSLSLYAELIYDRNEYDTLLANGNPNRDSNGYAIIGGTNFDLAGLMRGSVGVGYSRRDYKSELYPDAKGLSVEAEVEFFPSPITTVGITARRQIQDAALGSTSAYSDNRVGVRIDHEFLENLIISTTADITRRDYFESPQYTDVLSVATEARFQMTRGLSFGGNLRYGSSRPHGSSLGRSFDEFRATISVRIRR